MKKTPMFKLLVLSAAVAIVATGCAQSSSSQETPSETDELIPITVGTLPVPDMAPLEWANDKGIFEEHGLDVTLETLQGGPVGVQKVATNELQFSFANQISTMIAQDAGAPVITIGMLSALGEGSLGIYVPENSPVETIADLNGLTVATNTVNNVGDVTFKNIVAEQGLDIEPTWVEVPYPEIAPGIERGSVDAGFLPEPFATAGRDAGLRRVVDLTTTPNEASPVSGFITSRAYAEENPAVVEMFQKAIDEAREQMASDEDAFREWWPTVSQTSAEHAAAMVLPDYATPMTNENMTALADQLKAIGLVSEEFDATSYLQLLGS